MNYNSASAPLHVPGLAPGLYGAGSHSVIKEQPFARWQRRRLNAVAICLSLFVPWAMFCSMFWVMSFSLHYKHSVICYAIAFVALAIIGIIGMFAWDAILKRERLDPDREPTWLIFLASTAFLAWAAGIAAGDINYYYNMEPYYDTINLNTYLSVDPARMTGEQLMDAGRIVFTPETRLDLSRSMGFKNLELYCVAPIVTGKKPLSSYDFWAVGTNCCSGNSADFHCGEFNNANARAGLRLMRDDGRPFFRLAVQQAEAAFNIRADHPLFFQWMQDPIAEINTYLDEGSKYYILGILTYFIIQLFLVTTATLLFSRLTYPYIPAAHPAHRLA